jgi:hypothetical protein
LVALRFSEVSSGASRTLPVPFDTVTVMAAEVAVAPPVSRATAVSVCAPSVALVVSHATE